MPLPPALASRLAKRGIMKPPEPEGEEEEVIAEDYDDQEKQVDVNDNNMDYDVEAEEEQHDQDDVTEPLVGCPNKWNVYHLCSVYCKERWGTGKLQPSPNTERKRLRMLKKYPVIEGWEEVYDPGTGRHYYWNKRTGEVSWLPPGHPRCKISLPANKLRALVRDTLVPDAEDGEEHEPSESEEEEDEDQEEMETEHADVEEDRNKHRNRDRQHDRSRGRAKVRENDLDPMDPAAYSEAPRGTWSTGLDRKGEAKTGADTTASGPLYQMRPYPSPGAVLRMNAEIKSEVKSDDEEEEEEKDK